MPTDLTSGAAPAAAANPAAALGEAAMRHARAWAFDLRSRRIFLAPAARTLLGLAPGATAATLDEWLACVHPDDRARMAQALSRPDGAALDIAFDFRLDTSRSALRWLSAVGRFECEGGRPVVGAGILVDVTERRLEEERLRFQEQQLRAVADGVSVLIAYVDADLRYRFVNRSYQRWFGRTPESVLGSTVREIIGETAFARVEPRMREALGGAEVRFTIDSDAGGTPRQVEVLYTPHLDDAGRAVGIFAVVTDVSERTRAEQALRASEEAAAARATELAAVLDATPATIWIARDPECREIVGNEAAHAMLRMPPEQNLSKSNDAEGRLAHFRVFREGRELAPEEMPLQRAARGEVLRHFEEELVFDNGTRVHLMGNAVPLRDAAGGLRGAIGAFVDVTSLKQALEALHEADRRKDEFLALLGHELRSPLSAIQSSAHLLDRIDAGAAVARLAGVLQRQSSQLGRLVDDLLDVSRVTHGKIALQMEDVVLSTAIDRAVEASRFLIESQGHRLEVRLPPEPVVLHADLARLSQVVCNLLNNAAKYTPRGGHIAVDASAVDGMAIVRVRDDGVGLTAEALTRIFRLFEQGDDARTRSQGGLGVGLALAQALVELHGGSLTAASDGPDRGSTFEIRLPLRPRT